MQSSANLPIKIRLAVLIFILGSLLSTVRIAKDAPVPAHLAPDDISKRSDQRFAILKAGLPTQGVVGYIGEPGDLALGDYYLAQYALAPLVVEHSKNHSIVIGNFPNSQPSFPPDLQLVRDFGNGLLLFADKDAQ
jgi:hypothetical protein